MKKFIKSTLFFLIFPIVIYSIFICIWGDIVRGIQKKELYYYPIGTYGHTYSRLKEVKNIENVDILFIGSSHAYRSFDTRIFNESGYKVFNLGTSAQTPIETIFLLKRYLDTLNPKLVIFEVFPETFTKDGVESSLDVIANDVVDFNSFLMALKINNKKTYNALIYSFYQQILGKNKCNEDKVRRYDHYIGGGYVENKLTYSDTVNYVNYNLKWNDKQFDTFEGILTMLGKKKIDVIIVQTPIIRSLYKSYNNKNSFDSMMNNYGEYYNFNNILNLDDSLHYFDDDHLNQTGVNIFNNKLIELLKEKNYIF